MKKFPAIALGIMLAIDTLSSSAFAGSTVQDTEMARQAYHSSDIRQIQADKDLHAADRSALDGNLRAANAYSRAADVRAGQARSDARLSHHENDVAKWNASHR